MAHKHSVYDTDPHFMIDPITRAITTESQKIKLMQRDHRSERFTFEIPRYIDGHDMSLCNDIKIHFNNIAANKADQSKSVHKVDDMQIYTEDENVVIFSWLVERDATMYGGILNFSICFACLADDNTIEYEWHTDIYAGIIISDGIHNDEYIIENYCDILEQWKKELFGTGETAEQHIKDVSQAEQQAIEEKGEMVKNSLPEDYTTMWNLAEDSVRTRANAIVSTVQSDALVINDASGDYLRGLKLFGKSVQDGTPTPDAPVEIVSIENAKTIVTRKNLAYFADNERQVQDGITWSCKDGVVTAKGTSTAISATGKFIVCNITGLKGTFFVSGSSSQIGVFVAIDKAGVMSWYQEKSFELDGTENSVVVYCQIASGVTVDQSIYPMLNVGTSVQEWECGEEHQTLLLPYTLNGIPVASGGNYTDASGQAWICDEIDLARGVHIQRIREVVFDGTEAWYKHDTVPSMFILWNSQSSINGMAYPSLCNLYEHTPVELANVEVGQRFNNNQDGEASLFYIKDNNISTVEDFKAMLAEKSAAGNPMKLFYVLYNKIETPLSDVEIAKYKALRSNYPHTTVINNQNMWMEVVYNADTAIFLHNQMKPTDEQVLENVSAYLDANPAITHEWDGTVLKVTSASDTSSANLKGEKGDVGKSAYEYAKEKGYAGTEDEYATQLFLVASIVDGNGVAY